MAKQAFKILEGCKANPLANSPEVAFKAGLKTLGGLDALSQFNQKKWTEPLDYLEQKQFYADQMNPFAKPGIGAKSLEGVDREAIAISRLEDGAIEFAEDGVTPIWRWLSDGTEFKWTDDVYKLKSHYAWGGTSYDHYYTMPIWYGKVKNRMMEFIETPEFLSQFTTEGAEAVVEDVKRYFAAIELGKMQGAWWTSLGTLVWGDQANIWKFLATTGGHLERIANDKDYAEHFLGAKFLSDKEYRDVMVGIAQASGQRTSGYMGIYSQLDEATKKLLKDEGPVEYTYKLSKDSDTSIVNGFYDYGYFQSYETIHGREATYRHINELVHTQFTPWKKFQDFVALNIGYRFGSWVETWFSRFISPVLYGALLFLTNGFQGAWGLLSLNSTMFVTDKVAGLRRSLIGTNTEWGKFLSDNRILTSMDKSELDFISFDIETLGDSLVKGYGMGKSMFMNGLFNVTDKLMESSFQAKKANQFFSTKFPTAKTVGEVQMSMQLLSPESREALVQQARDYIEYSVRLETTNTKNSLVLANVSAANNVAYQPWKRMRNKLFNFYAGWGHAKVNGAVDILKDGVTSWKSPTKQMLLDRVHQKDLTPTEMSELIDNLYLKNTDLINLVYKFKTSIMLANYVQRVDMGYIEKQNDSIIGNLAETIELLQVFDSNTAAIQSTPLGRIALEFAERLFADANYNGVPDFNLPGATAAAAREFLRSTTRGLFVPTGILSGILDVTNRDENGNLTMDDEKSLTTAIFQGIQRQASGFLHYLRDSVYTEGFEQGILVGPNMTTNQLLGIQPKELREYQDMLKDRQYRLLYSSPEVFVKWLQQSPIVKEFYMDDMADRTGFYPAWQNFRNSDMYDDYISEGHLPPDMFDEEYVLLYNNIFRRLELNDEKWNDALIKADRAFLNDNFEEVTNWKVRRQEDIFNSLLQEGVSKEDAQLYTYYLSRANKGYDKEAVRTLAYISENIPGAGLQALAYVMYSEYYDMMYESGIKRGGPIPTEIANAAKNQIARKYGDFIFDVDKQHVWPQFVMNYAAYHFPEMSQYILTGDGNLKVSFNEEWQDSQMYKLFLLELHTDILASNGEINAYAVNNTFSTLLEPSGTYVDSKGNVDPAYAAWALDAGVYLLNKFDNMPILESEREYAKMGLLLGLDKMLQIIVTGKYTGKDGYTVNDTRIKDQHHDTLQEVLHFLRGSSDYIENLAVEYAQNNYEQANSGTGRGGYSNARYGSNYYNRFQDNDYVRSAIADMVRKYQRYINFAYWPRDFFNRTYNAREYKQAFNRLSQIGGMSSGGGGSSQGERVQNAPEPGGSTSQRSGSARPFIKVEDPDKPIEYLQRGGWKRARRSKAIDTAAIASSWKRLVQGKPKF